MSVTIRVLLLSWHAIFLVVSAAAEGEETCTSETCDTAKNRRAILLWAPPRARSTAFERAMMEHPMVNVFHESFADPHYFGPDSINLSDASAAAIGSSGLDRNKTYLQVVQELLGGGGAQRPWVFSKELSLYFNSKELSPEVLSQFTNTFLIRSPTQSVSSFWKTARESGGTTYFDPDEAGFKELAQIFTIVTNTLGQPAVVVDADDLVAQPEQTLRKYCDAVGLPWVDGITSWDTKEPDVWKKWKGWHEDAAQSTGFQKQASATKVALDAQPDIVRRVIEESQPHYDLLYKERLAVLPS